MSESDTVAIIGAGTLGLGVVAALGFLSSTGRSAKPGHLMIAARYPVQRQMAKSFGADEVVDPRHLTRAVRSAVRSDVVGSSRGDASVLASGADIVIDCVGSEESLAESLRIVKPGGRLILVGMPGKVNVDLAPLWHREVELVGAYAYGTELIDGQEIRTFDLAIEMAGALETGRIVSARYPLDRYAEALAHAGSAGMRGAIKIVFDVSPKRATAKREA